MATYQGSGRFVALAAAEEPFFGNTINGITFGRDQKAYCKVTPLYKEDGTNAPPTALTIFSDAVEFDIEDVLLDDDDEAEGEYLQYTTPLILDFPRLEYLRVGSSATPVTAYLGAIYNVEEEDWYGYDEVTMETTTLYFYRGLLVDPGLAVRQNGFV